MYVFSLSFILFYGSKCLISSTQPMFLTAFRIYGRLLYNDIRKMYIYSPTFIFYLNQCLLFCLCTLQFSAYMVINPCITLSGKCGQSLQQAIVRGSQGSFSLPSVTRGKTVLHIIQSHNINKLSHHIDISNAFKYIQLY